MNRPLKLDQKGLSLVEVIVSVVILLVGIIGVIRPMMGAAEAMQYLDARYSGGFVMNQKMWELLDEVANSKRPSNLNREETLAAGRRTFDYEVSMKEVVNVANLYDVQLRLSWLQGGLKKNLIREFYLSFPKVQNAKNDAGF